MTKFEGREPSEGGVLATQGKPCKGQGKGVVGNPGGWLQGGRKTAPRPQEKPQITKKKKKAH